MIAVHAPRSPHERIGGLRNAAFALSLTLLGVFAIPPQAVAAERTANIALRPVTLTVLSLNLWHDKTDWPKRRALIVAEIKRLQPDVIALQEVLQHEGLRNQAQDLADALGYQAQFVSVDAADAPRRYGNAILTRMPVAARDMHKLAPLNDYRTVAHALLRVGAQHRGINVYATHLHNDAGGGEIRREQIASLLGFVDATAQGAPTIVAGDFNSNADSPELRALAARYRDAYAQAHPREAGDAAASSTLNPAYLPAQRIDHVFYDPAAFELMQARIVLNRSRDGVWASDHFGLLATLRLRGGTPSTPSPN
ncbi:MAG: endonuclease/exonuclease/phosphatase family protein [Lysobacter sp.]|nr:endonuclease/exonuclease/phosphatase family protein [Lysobacter sp.]